MKKLLLALLALPMQQLVCDQNTFHTVIWEDVAYVWRDKQVLRYNYKTDTWLKPIEVESSPDYQSQMVSSKYGPLIYGSSWHLFNREAEQFDIVRWSAVTDPQYTKVQHIAIVGDYFAKVHEDALRLYDIANQQLVAVIPAVSARNTYATDCSQSHVITNILNDGYFYWRSKTLVRKLRINEGGKITLVKEYPCTLFSYQRFDPVFLDDNTVIGSAGYVSMVDSDHIESIVDQDVMLAWKIDGRGWVLAASGSYLRGFLNVDGTLRRSGLERQKLAMHDIGGNRLLIYRPPSITQAADTFEIRNLDSVFPPEPQYRTSPLPGTSTYHAVYKAAHGYIRLHSTGARLLLMDHLESDGKTIKSTWCIAQNAACKAVYYKEGWDYLYWHDSSGPFLWRSRVDNSETPVILMQVNYLRQPLYEDDQAIWVGANGKIIRIRDGAVDVYTRSAPQFVRHLPSKGKTVALVSNELRFYDDIPENVIFNHNSLPYTHHTYSRIHFSLVDNLFGPFAGDRVLVTDSGYVIDLDFPPNFGRLEGVQKLKLLEKVATGYWGYNSSTNFVSGTTKYTQLTVPNMRYALWENNGQLRQVLDGLTTPNGQRRITEDGRIEYIVGADSLSPIFPAVVDSSHHLQAGYFDSWEGSTRHGDWYKGGQSFGLYHKGYAPWVWQSTLGWVKMPVNEDPKGYWIESPDWGFLWLLPRVFPKVWHPDIGWIQFHRDPLKGVYAHYSMRYKTWGRNHAWLPPARMDRRRLEVLDDQGGIIETWYFRPDGRLELMDPVDPETLMLGVTYPDESAITGNTVQLALYDSFNGYVLSGTCFLNFSSRTRGAIELDMAIYDPSGKLVEQARYRGKFKMLN